MKILMTNLTKMVNHSDGVAKVVCAFANEMVKRGHEVSIIHSDEKEGKFFFDLDASIKIYNANRNADGSIVKRPLYLKALREFLRPINRRKAQLVNRDYDEKTLAKNIKRYVDILKPDVIVSHQPEGSMFLLHNLKVNIPVLTMSHGLPKKTFDEKEAYALEHSVIYQLLSPSFEKHINNILPKVRTVVIGNSVPQFDFSADLESEKAQYKIVYVGRLNKNTKRPHLIVQALAKLKDQHPNWIVELWGEKERQTYYVELERLIKSNNLQDRVFLKGTTNNVPEVLKYGDIFAFPSFWEGFGLALAEGMSAGLPAVGFKTCPGVNELIRDGESGYLCEDNLEAFTKALDKLMSNRDLRIKMGQAAKESMKQFAPQKNWDKWENLIVNAVKDM